VKIAMRAERAERGARRARPETDRTMTDRLSNRSGRAAPQPGAAAPHRDRATSRERARVRLISP
jgi:hypothetical protein